jgi:hypothetical protein
MDGWMVHLTRDIQRPRVKLALPRGQIIGRPCRRVPLDISPRYFRYEHRVIA